MCSLSTSCVRSVTQPPDFVDCVLDSPRGQEYTGLTGMRHVPLAAWGGSINRRSAGGSERVSGMEDLDLVRGPQAFWGLSHLRVYRPRSQRIQTRAQVRANPRNPRL